MSSNSDDPSTLISSPPSAYTTPASAATKAKRRSSYDILHGIAGPDSNIPLPKRVDDAIDSAVNPNPDVIREGIPLSSLATKRPPSPTRSLSRTSSPLHTHSTQNLIITHSLTGIPVAAVGNARALADDGLHHHHHPTIITPARQTHRRSISKSHSTTDLSLSISITPGAATGGDTSFSSLAPPSPTPNGVYSSSLISSVNHNPPSPSSSSQTKRFSTTPGGTTKVLADLQAGVINARNALENTKSQLRLSQRTVASLTRKVEDLKEVEERLRIENEGLNNVVARKERLLQEVLERARKAESEATSLKQQLKQETSTSKKTIREMEIQLTESTAVSKKSEREYIILRDSIKSLTETWKSDTESLKSDIRKREEKWRKEVDGVGKKYKDLCASVKEKEKILEEEWKKTRQDDKKRQEEVERTWTERVEKMHEVVEKSGRDCEKAERTAQDLALELTILKKRMKSLRTPPTDDDDAQGRNNDDATATNSTIASDSTLLSNVPP